MSLEEQISQAQAERSSTAAQMQPAPALVLLGQQLGLSSFEQDVLLLCAAPELDMRVASLCAQAHSDASRAYPTFALALALFDEPVWDALSPDRPLRYWRLIEISQPGGTPLTASPLRADERLVSYLKGLNRLDDRLSTVLFAVPAGDVTALAPSQLDVVNEVLWHWQHTSVSVGLPVAQLLGTDPASKLLVAQALAAVLNRDRIASASIGWRRRRPSWRRWSGCGSAKAGCCRSCSMSTPSPPTAPRPMPTPRWIVS